MNSTPRRSMTEALQTVELPPEAAAFIHAGTPRPKIRAVDGPAPEEKAEAPGQPAAEPPSVRTQMVTADDMVSTAPDPEPPVMQSRSFRLPMDLCNALLRFSLERRLARQRPWTQEDMVAQALQHWMRKNGYSGKL